MEDLKPIIAKNISTLRVRSGMTQLELAEKLHYSDKAVSKWERGESIPDVTVLKAVADLFGVTVDDLLREDASPSAKPQTSPQTFVLITAISLLGVMCLALLLFALTRSVLSFVFAVPAGLIVWLVLNSIWFNRRRNYLIVSLLMWSLLLTLCIVCASIGRPMWLLLLSGLPGQVIILLCSRFKAPK